jgi:hypothetical protein
VAARKRRGNFRAAADTVVRRLVLARWTALLEKSALPVFVPAVVLLVATRLGGARWNELPAALALTALWIGCVALLTWLRRPQGLAALALWDERAGRHEAFASACCFESSARRTPGQELHLAHAQALLDQALPSLPAEVPVRVRPRALLVPAVFLALVASGLLRCEVAAEEAALEQDALARARAAADVIEEESLKLKDLAGLKPEELAAAEKLKQKLKQTAEKMRDPGDSGSRELLSELEKRAREAEKLARLLDAEEVKDLSGKFLDELGKHADLGKLAAALKAKDLEASKLSAEELARKLKASEFSKEESKRLKDALEKALKAGDDKDLKSAVGEGLAAARDELAAGDAGGAGQQMAQMAEQLGAMAQREQARRRLERLVKMMRDAGWQMNGRQMRRLTPRRQNPFAGMLEPMPDGRRMAMMPSDGGMPGDGGMSMPSGGMPGGDPGEMPGGMPGAMPGGGEMPGTGMGGMGGEEGTGSGFGMGGMTPVPGGEAMGMRMAMARAGTGGSRAGRGTAPLVRKQTRAFKAGGTLTVTARPGKQGTSIVRTIDPSGHRENAIRSEKELAVKFINAEEDALDEEFLPLSRREQILRYFTALRRQLER